MFPASIFSDFLQQLGVPHTVSYSDAQFAAMPFQSLFGLSKLLESYGVPNKGYRLNDKSEIATLTAPFLADTPHGLVIVTDIGADSVTYMTQGETEHMSVSDFISAFNGIVLLAFPKADACEPHYAEHRRIELIIKAKKYVLMIGAAALFVYLFVTNGLYRHWSTVGLAIVDIAGLILSFMLVQKSLNIKNKAADAVCGVLEKGGCDSILELSVSSFYGIFKWSEVGLTYFTVSLMTLLIFPQWINYLALCNIFCLPYTFWSIWYQRFRAHKWCTMCVGVQTSLWLLFFCYLLGGWIRDLWPLHIEFFVLAVTYITVLLALNRILPLFDKHETSYNNEAQTDNTSAA